MVGFGAGSRGLDGDVVLFPVAAIDHGVAAAEARGSDSAVGGDRDRAVRGGIEEDVLRIVVPREYHGVVGRVESVRLRLVIYKIITQSNSHDAKTMNC
jgi:hypothetical protein